MERRCGERREGESGERNKVDAVRCGIWNERCGVWDVVVKMKDVGCGGEVV